MFQSFADFRSPHTSITVFSELFYHLLAASSMFFAIAEGTLNSRPQEAYKNIWFSRLIESADGVDMEKHWCIADEQTPDDVLQKALDWACGFGGADCRMIQPHNLCYQPNTVKDHASYAFNSYWQKYKKHGGTCYFKSAAMVTDLDPSHGSCRYETLP